jgi:hypothetical protein
MKFNEYVNEKFGVHSETLDATIEDYITRKIYDLIVEYKENIDDESFEFLTEKNLKRVLDSSIRLSLMKLKRDKVIK